MGFENPLEDIQVKQISRLSPRRFDPARIADTHTVLFWQVLKFQRVFDHVHRCADLVIGRQRRDDPVEERQVVDVVVFQ